MRCLIYKANNSQPIPNFHEFYPWATPNVMLRYLGELFGFFGKLHLARLTHRLLEGGWFWLLLLKVRILLLILKVRILLLLLKKARSEEDDGDGSKWGRDQYGEHLMRVLLCLALVSFSR